MKPHSVSPSPIRFRIQSAWKAFALVNPDEYHKMPFHPQGINRTCSNITLDKESFVTLVVFASLLA
jgi:hypothetical protein